MLLRGTGHSGLEVESRRQRLLIDPWWSGAAHAGRWQAVPAPRPGSPLLRAGDAVAVTSLHDDRLHRPTLRRLPPGLPVFVPEFVGLPPPAVLARTLGRPVRLLPHGRPVALGRRFFVTAWIQGDEAALILDDDEEVIVHAGTALATAPLGLADLFARFCRRVRGRVDVLLAGAVPLPEGPLLAHLPGHDPCRALRAGAAGTRVALRQLVELVAPTRAFVLPMHPAVVDARLRWLERALHDLPLPDEADAGSGPICPFLLPGDYVRSATHERGSSPRPDAAHRERIGRRALRLQPPAEPVSDARLQELAVALAGRARALRERLGPRARVSLELRIRENPATALHFEVSQATADAGLGPPRSSGARLELPAAVLEALLHQDAGEPLVRRAQGALASLDHPGQRADVELFLAGVRPGRTQRAWPWRLSAALRQAVPLAFAAAGRLGLIGLPELPAPNALPERLDRRAA